MADAPRPIGRGDRPRGPDERPLGPDAGASASAPPRPDRRRVALLAGGWALVLACIAVLALISTMVWRNEKDALDAWATPFLHALASPALDALANAASFVGTDVVLAAAIAVLVLVLALRRRRREAAFLVVAIGGAALLNGAMKLFFHRQRPSLAWAHVPPDYSFPSGHAMNSMAVALAVGVVVWQLAGRRAGLVAFVVGIAASLVIGASRVYLGDHYLTDVVGGFAASILWVGLVVAAFRPATWQELLLDRRR